MKRLTKACGTALLSLFIPICHASSQAFADSSRFPNDSIPFAPLTHPSYFWAGWPQDAWYEGDVNIPVHLWSRTAALKYPDHVKADNYDCWPNWIGNVVRRAEQALLPSPGAQRLRATGCTLTFVPHFVLRQLSGGSAPVQTPTFNPAFEWTRYTLYLEDSASVTARRSVRAGAWRTASLTGLHVRFGHYSNGQSGCLYENQAPGSCAILPGIPETLNRTDGSFSTHYVEPALTLARLRFDSTGHERRLASITLAVRHNPGNLADVGGMSDELARTYGRQSVSASSVIRWRAERSRLLRVRTVTNVLLEGECAVERPEPYDTCRGSAGLSLSFPGMYGFGFAARYVGGWDYYNVGYGEQLRNPGRWRPMFGIVLDHSVPLVIRR
jgi:hypothetical protein